MKKNFNGLVDLKDLPFRKDFPLTGYEEIR